MYAGKEAHHIIIILITTIVLIATVYFCLENEKNICIEQSRVYKESHSWFQDLSFRGEMGEMQQVGLFKAEDGSWSAFIPSEMKGTVSLHFSQFRELQIEDERYSSGDWLHDIQDMSECTMIAKGWEEDITEEATVHFYFAQDIPTIYLKSDGSSMEAVNADKSVREKVKIMAVDEYGEKSIAGECTIKTRGNSAFRDVKQKSYSINLESEMPVLGLSPGTKWALLANYREDLQQLKNKIAFDVAKRMGMEYIPDSRFVNVYIDGQYNGLYLLAQRVSANGGSVQIHTSETSDEAAGFEMVSENISGGYLLEFDIRATQEEYWFELNNQTVGVKSPDSVSEEKLLYIMYYMKKVEYILFSEAGMNPDTGET